jgi:predicted dithiol-disulfide oxidoreductase (DUF899 family)
MNNAVVSNEQWLDARKALLIKEKELSRQRDEVCRLRREMPWEKVEKPYVFQTSNGQETLSDLFEGRSQLIMYHFMFAPGAAQGCQLCSFLADHIDPGVAHLKQRDVTLVVSSRAPLSDIEPFKKRMGWSFNWVSSDGSDFNYDYHVSFTKESRVNGKVNYNYAPNGFPQDEAPGLSVFAKDANGDVFHTYSTYSRGLDIVMGTYNYLDLAPKGRDEKQLPFSMSWVRHHDRYESQPKVAACCHAEEARV